MHQILLDKVTKKYNNDYVFKNITSEFIANNIYAITGSNGSGKSTLLQILTGLLIPTNGTCILKINNEIVEINNWYKYYSFSSPYMQIFEEYSLIELLDFHTSVKPFLNNYNTKNIIAILGFEKQQNKLIKYYSSGMKQRVKLVLAIMSKTPVLLLDEPCANLDAQGVHWYKDMLSAHVKDRIIIIASNSVDNELFLCNKQLDILNYK